MTVIKIDDPQYANTGRTGLPESELDGTLLG